MKKFQASMFLFAFLFTMILIACSKAPSKSEMETEIKRQATEQLHNKGLKIECTKVSLMKESDNKYSGLAEFSNGEKEGINVTVDGEEFVWKPDRAN